ncbi:MAG: hypothetical protein PWP23_2031 [Candidatus Sumerlaeota bacterium]|nr:hypothetical protein [Candidatus Sumerlaeota bacterium]
MNNRMSSWAVAAVLAALLSVSSFAPAESPTPPPAPAPAKSEAGQGGVKLVTAVYKDVQLQQVAASLEEQSGARIELGPGVGEMRVSVLKRSAPLAEVIDSIALANGLRAVPLRDRPGFFLVQGAAKEPQLRKQGFAPPPGMSVGDLAALLQPLVPENGKLVQSEQSAEVLVSAAPAAMERVRQAAEALGSGTPAPIRLPEPVLEQVREPLRKRYPGAEIFIKLGDGSHLVVAGTEPDRTHAEAYLRVLARGIKSQPAPAENAKGEAGEPRKAMDRAARLKMHEERIKDIIQQRREEAAKEESRETP